MKGNYANRFARVAYNPTSSKWEWIGPSWKPALVSAQVWWVARKQLPWPIGFQQKAQDGSDAFEITRADGWLRLIAMFRSMCCQSIWILRKSRIALKKVRRAWLTDLTLTQA